MLALPTTPLTLIAAPGPGKMILPIVATISERNYVADYTNINANALLNLDNSGGNGSTLTESNNNTDGGSSNLLAAGGNGMMLFSSYQSIQSSILRPASAMNPANFDNAPLQLRMDNQGSGNLTGGDVSQQFVITVLYEIANL